jgi:hypothetical protein
VGTVSMRFWSRSQAIARRAVEESQPIARMAESARELLARTAELPGSKRELLMMLNEYRATVHAFAAAADEL